MHVDELSRRIPRRFARRAGTTFLCAAAVLGLAAPSQGGKYAAAGAAGTSWTVTARGRSVFVGNSGFTRSEPAASQTVQLEFEPDGALTIFMHGASHEGTWTQKGKKVRIESESLRASHEEGCADEDLPQIRCSATLRARAVLTSRGDAIRLKFKAVFRERWRWRDLRARKTYVYRAKGEQMPPQ